MKILRRKSSLLLCALVLIGGCQSTKNFRMMPSAQEELYVVETDGNRIIQQCYFMNAEKENNWRHQYILSMLNENNEAITVYNPTNQGKDECMAHLKKVERILKNTSRVRLCVRDKLEKMDDDSTHEILDFGPLGKHPSPYWALTFDTICNSKDCYSISDTWTYTCSEFKK